MLYIDHLNQNFDNPILRKQLTSLSNKEKDLRDKAKEIVHKVDPKSETNDKDYVFIYFILNYLPTGLIGLLLAVIFSAIKFILEINIPNSLFYFGSNMILEEKTHW